MMGADTSPPFTFLAKSGEVVTSTSGFQSDCLRSMCRDVGRLFLRDSDGGISGLVLNKAGPGVVGGVEKVSTSGERDCCLSAN